MTLFLKKLVVFGCILCALWNFSPARVFVHQNRVFSVVFGGLLLARKSGRIESHPARSAFFGSLLLPPPRLRPGIQIGDRFGETQRNYSIQINVCFCGKCLVLRL